MLTGYRKYACDECDKRFMEAYHLTRHKFLIHSQDTTPSNRGNYDTCLCLCYIRDFTFKFVEDCVQGCTCIYEADLIL